MDRDRQYLHALDSPDALLEDAARAALSHAQKNRTGLRGWKPSQLTWEVQEQLWDENLGCSVILIAAQPLGQSEAPQALWEYWLDDHGKIIPGFPAVKNMPDWGVPGASIQGRRIDGPRPTKMDARTLMGAIAVAALIVLGSLGWVAVDPSGDDDANAPVAAISPTPAPFISPTPRPRPTPTPAPAPTLAPTPITVVGKQVEVAPTIVQTLTPAPKPLATISNFSFSQETGASGDQITIAGSGFPSFSPVESLIIGGVPASTIPANTDASGNIVTAFIVPHSAPAGIQTLKITIGGVTRSTSFQIFGPSPAPRLASTPVPTPADDFSGPIFFADDFEGGAAGDWSNVTTNTAHTNNLTEFLGNFGSDTVSLTLIRLPTHSEVQLRFDLYLLDSWDGDGTNCPGCGPDYFLVGHGAGLRNLLFETFGTNQSYSATRPEPSRCQLGFNSAYCDAIYRNINNGFYFPHKGDSLNLNFSAMGLQALSDESWGIDNVRIALILEPAVPPTAGPPAPEPTPTPTSAPTKIPSGPALTLTPAPTPTPLPTQAPTPTPTAIPLPTPTPVPTPTPEPKPVLAPTATALPTATPVPKATPLPTATPALATTPTPISEHFLWINGFRVGVGQTTMPIDRGTVVLDRSPNARGSYPQGMLVTLRAIPNSANDKVDWAGVLGKNGKLAAVDMKGETFVTVNLYVGPYNPVPTPWPGQTATTTATPASTPEVDFHRILRLRASLIVSAQQSPLRQS